ncbi:unnamed protein product [Durusdinium trenchii]|uniref:Carrier domain-containing protein n=1 Tax=Durusdinium trenchii TaxID=1381693 RepID=A0ABP0QN90_9DINO
MASNIGDVWTALGLVWESVKLHADRTALRYLTVERTLGCLTYRQVWQLSGLVAQRCGGSVLAVAIDDGPYLALAELAGWRRSMILVPLDPHDPPARLHHVMSEAKASCCVTKDWGDAKKLLEAAEALPVEVIDLSLAVPLSMELPLHVALEAPEWLQPESVAYMWFTSGSTGQPKGVLISHRAFSNWCKVKTPPQGISRESVVLIASASTFDPSIGDIFATWAVGGTVAVAPRMLFFANLGWTIERLTVSHVTCTPSLWQSLETEMDCSSLTLCLGGERSPQPLLDLWAPKLTLLNTYGTTECTVWQTLRRMELGDKATLVGSPYAGNEIEILEKDGTTEVPDGEVGEIVQGGMQVGIGYYNRPELTAQKFVERPGRNGKWYRTGDGGILRREPRCELEVVGRFDSQVKIRGMRVELGEIEIGVVKAAAGLLSNCAVKLRDSFLVAYCQVSAAASVMLHEPYCIMPVMSDFLLQRSSHELPRHMLPSKFILMQRLPLTANGKVDNKALPEVVDASTSTSSSLTALERVVAGIWEEVLGRKGIGPNDHFLALGGHSMSVLQVSRRLLKLAAAAGQDVSPASALGILLSPEKLIHSPRLRIYCQMLARGGVRFAAVGGSEEEQIGEEDVAELRINYVKHKVKSSDAELDHGAWEQVPLAGPELLLCRASEAGLLPLVQLLLSEGAQVEGGLLEGQYARHGSTPLILAVMGNHLCCAEELLSYSAQPERRDAHGTPVLHKAAERCGERMVALLLKARADVEAMDTASRSTALHAAVKAGNVATTTALLQSSARMDWLDRWNRTALHWAIFHNHLEGCKVLLQSGAKVIGTLGEQGGRILMSDIPCGNLPRRVSKRTKDFVTPMDLAKELAFFSETRCGWRFHKGNALLVDS